MPTEHERRYETASSQSADRFVTLKDLPRRQPQHWYALPIPVILFPFFSMPKLKRFIQYIISRKRSSQVFIPAEAPRLQFDEVFSPTMSLSSLNGFFLDPSTPNKPAGVTSSPATGSPHHPSNEHDPHSKQLAMHANRFPSSPRSEADLSNLSSNPGTPGGDANDSPWSAAVGRATTGKSGRVIERLMGDNDRLQREKNFATVKLEEEVKRSESARSALETLQASNQNLMSMHEQDKSVLARRERRIEELRVDLGAEKSRREHAECETRETKGERDRVVEKLMRETMEEREQSRRSTSQYDVLSKSWKGLEEKYSRQMQKLKVDVQTLQDEIEKDKNKLARLEVIEEQLRQEGEKTRRAKEKLSKDFENYKIEKEEGIREMREQAEKNELANSQALAEMGILLGEMKYVVNVRKDVRDFE